MNEQPSNVIPFPVPLPPPNWRAIDAVIAELERRGIPYQRETAQEPGQFRPALRVVR